MVAFIPFVLAPEVVTQLSSTFAFVCEFCEECIASGDLTVCVV